MRTQDIIADKRDGRENSKEQIEALVSGYVAGEIPDYQMAAWLMAVYMNGMSDEETLSLTSAMTRSGETLDLSSLPAPRVDKHSTGGVGDKTSLVVVPLLAACGCTVVKMSGRGLGITGGTIDKLESIPGFRTSLSPDEMLAVARRVGCCIAGQSERVAPADKLIYSLRDATATVGCLPLITSSIMSKKLAVGADVISLDVKCGSGSTVGSIERARDLAASMVRVGRLAGKKVVATITDMSAPLGNAVGNLLEVREAIETLRGGGPARFMELCLSLAAETLAAAGLSPGLASAGLSDGSGLARFKLLLAAQGADPAVADDPSLLPVDLSPVPVLADRAGWVAGIDAAAIGTVVLSLGAGRATKDAVIDPAVGVVLRTSIGEQVVSGQPVADLYVRAGDAGSAPQAVLAAVDISHEPAHPKAVILESFTG